MFTRHAFYFVLRRLMRRHDDGFISRFAADYAYARCYAAITRIMQMAEYVDTCYNAADLLRLLMPLIDLPPRHAVAICALIRVYARDCCRCRHEMRMLPRYRRRCHFTLISLDAAYATRHADTCCLLRCHAYVFAPLSLERRFI